MTIVDDITERVKEPEVVTDLPSRCFVDTTMEVTHEEAELIKLLRHVRVNGFDCDRKSGHINLNLAFGWLPNGTGNEMSRLIILLLKVGRSYLD